MSSSTLHPVEPSNKHISVDPHGRVSMDLTFVEEPLGLPAKNGYSWPEIDFGQTIGPENRYSISRKLGWGMSSSTWLARDLMAKSTENSFVAIKVLSGYTTDLVQRGRVWELQALKQVSSPPSSPHCLHLASDFMISGREGAWQHLCLVTQVLGGDVKALSEKYDGVFPFPLAKCIILHILRGLDHAHKRGIVHTDLKHDNIFFEACMLANDFEKLLVSDPPRRHPPEASAIGIVQAAVSQPLPVPTLTEAMGLNFVVADFGSAQPIADGGNIDEITALPLRPPEVIIGGKWNEKVDIWTFGCLIFELVTGRALFKYECYPKYKLDEREYLLYQMICYTGEDFGEEQLSASPLASQFFDSTCNLRADPPLINYPFELSIRNYKVVEEAEVRSTAALMRRCLCLDPMQRPSAAELLSDPWFDGMK